MQPNSNSQNLVSKPHNAVAPVPPQSDVPQCAWGGQDTSAKDMLIPNILLMQDISESVKAGKVKAGSIVNGVSGQQLCDKGGKLNIVPILTFREWEINELIESKGGKTKEKYVRRERMTAQNEGAEWTYTEDGKSFRRNRTIVCFVLVEGQIGDLPYIIRFKKSSLYAGKKLSTHFQMCAMKNVSPAKQNFSLLGEVTTNNDGESYYALDVIPSRATTPQEERAAYEWWKTLSLADSNVKLADDATVPF